MLYHDVLNRDLNVFFSHAFLLLSATLDNTFYNDTRFSCLYSSKIEASRNKSDEKSLESIQCKDRMPFSLINSSYLLEISLHFVSIIKFDLSILGRKIEIAKNTREFYFHWSGSLKF